MSITLATTAVLAQLCYHPQHDIGSHEFLRAAQSLEPVLLQMIEAKKQSCTELTSQQQLQEAKMIVLADATQITVSLEKP